MNFNKFVIIKFEEILYTPYDDVKQGRKVARCPLKLTNVLFDTVADAIQYRDKNLTIYKLNINVVSVEKYEEMFNDFLILTGAK